MHAIDVISKSLFPAEHLKIIPYMTLNGGGGRNHEDRESISDSFGTYSDDDAIKNQNQNVDQEIVTGKPQPIPKAQKKSKAEAEKPVEDGGDKFGDLMKALTAVRNNKASTLFGELLNKRINSKMDQTKYFFFYCKEFTAKRFDKLSGGAVDKYFVNAMLGVGKQDTKQGYKRAGTVVDPDTKPWDRKTPAAFRKKKPEQIELENSLDGDINPDRESTNTHKGTPVS